ncbi:M23 family metallopeptidase [Pontibacillus litoralis]|uniref:Peptidase M23 n=1 Tax=Pontibacillus litoralis JSM 072002 TaxID=1385512 RepID=A0A0A5G6H4_9BACI|nr:peptidase M23 [Pontibacillus litoralis JSM 072002]
MKTSVITIILLLLPTYTFAQSNDDPYDQRMALYQKYEAITNIPWYYLAAIDQYERNIQKEPISEGVISITIPIEKWNGHGNPNDHDTLSAEEAILFDGIGQDGDGDGLADRSNDEDILYTMANWIYQFGTTKQDVKIALWNYYERDLSVQSIMFTAKVYETFRSISLEDRIFPVPLQHNYSYRSTWGDPRGFGGRRIHEGTDIFANYGVPVRSTTYGVIEMKGWNRYGGWRIGIRDINNTYHYLAHLNGFEKGVSVGQVVKPGDVIGYVGATGYGPPGTSGKFPPHLHYGLYKDNGYSQYSFDPYPALRKWERLTQQQIDK